MATETLDDSSLRIATFIKEFNPQADTSPGSVISELVVKLAAAAQNNQYNTIDGLNQGNAISVVEAATTDTYSDTIDKIASNFNTSRYTGKLSTGKIKVTVANRLETVISSGSTFVQSGINLNYVTTQNYLVTPNPDPLSATSLQLYTGAGTWYFIISVEAAEVGSEYQVADGTQFSLAEDFILTTFVEASAYGSFSAGLPNDTDKQVVAKIQKNLTNKSVVSPRSISAMLSELYPSFQTVSVIGAMDAEMIRSKRNVLGISTFGKADLYVRTSIGAETIISTVTGTKISQGLWTVSITNDVVPGFYTVNSIIPTPVNNAVVGGTLVVDSTTFGYTQNAGERVNEISAQLDSRFTKYQTAVINFEYVETPTVANNTQASFDVSFKYQPYIEDIQNIFIGDDTRVISADYLVKAAVPCFVSLQIKLIRKNASDTLDSINVSGMKQDIFNYVNTIPFGESLNASVIVDICHNYPIKRVDLPLKMDGIIYTPTDETINISDSDFLSIPTVIDKGVSPKTTLYFIDYFRQVGTTVINSIDNIGITLT